MTLTESITETVGVTVESIELPAVLHRFPLEPRCRVCRNDRLRKKVNDMLATGIIDSIRNHTARHFPVQNVAKATYRRILEQRAQENGPDFINGVTTAITPMAFFETVMAKGYGTLVDPDTKVDVNTAMIAAGRLQALIDSRAGGTRITDLRVQMGRIIDAIHSSVPEELWPEILRKIDGPVAADAPADEFEDCGNAEDEYDR
jgi:hypothetical protein